MMKKIFFLAAFAAVIQANAQEIYDVSRIPAALTKNASVVVRDEEQVYEVKSPGSSVLTYKTVITILNQNGDDAARMLLHYDNFSSVYNLKAALYDDKGLKIKDYKSADFKDKSAVSDFSIYEDNRVKTLDFLHTDYPYTVAFSYSIDYNGMTSYAGWFPVKKWGYAVEKSGYTFKIPETMTFKYLKSAAMKTDSVKVKDKLVYKWACEQVKAIEWEPLSKSIANITPWVRVAPNHFEFDGHKGNIENWNNVGSWLYTLSNGLQVLPEATRLKVQHLIKDAKTPKEKIKILYNYLQSNTRYVSVQLGIGGLQPIAADKVAAVNYGDCKGLSNFMKAMLQEAGIKSNLVVIGNDMPSLNKKYASLDQANHMILCIPLEKDTTWLECTSQYKPAGFIGNDNSNRTVLLITESGGKLAQTPVYNGAGNYQKRSTKVELDEEGSANVHIETRYGNAQYEDNASVLFIDPTAQRKRMMNTLSIPNMQIAALSFIQPDKDVAVLNEKIDLKCSQLLTKGGDKLFITLNLLNRQESVVTPIENRRTFFSIEYSYTDEDEIIYTIPKGYKVEFMPADMVIESEFGRYSAKVVAKDNTLVYTRTKTMTCKTYPPEKYNDFVAFSKKMYQADKQKGILAKVE